MNEREQTSNDAGDEAMQAYAVVCAAHAYSPWYRAKSNEKTLDVQRTIHSL